MPGTLRDDILAIPGIDDAQLEGDATSPDGVRVRLSYGADPQHVGREVRRILALHGMRSQLTEVPDQVAPDEPPPPPPPAGTVVNLSDYESEAPSPPTGEVAVAGEPDTEDAAATEQAARAEETVSSPPAPDEAPTLEDEPAEEAVTSDEEAAPAAPESEVAGESSEAPAAEEPADDAAVVATPSGLAALGNVAVIEGAAGVTVTASTRLGKTKSRIAPPSSSGVDRAIVSAVSRLLVPEHDPPLLVEIIDAEREGELILTVVLELDAGDHAVGSAIQAASRPWAVARATRAALSAPE